MPREELAIGALLALFAALFQGLNNAAARRGVVSGTVFQALIITVPMAVPLFVVATVASGQTGALLGFSGRSLGFFALAGLFNFVWGRGCNYRATKALGGNLVGSVQQGSVVVALALAVTWLGESLTILKIVGVVLVVAGSTLATARRRRPARPIRAGSASFQPKPLEGYTFALLSIVGFGVSPALIKEGLAGSSAGVAGGLVAYAAATAFFGAMLLVSPGRRQDTQAVTASNARWFAFTGVFSFFGQLCRYTALAVAPVTVVVPIQRTAVIFRVLFNTLLNRQHEVLDKRIVAGIVVSVLGAVALGVSLASASSVLPLPSSVKTWSWP